jgi:predicted RNase H-like HicB family nuclease
MVNETRTYTVILEPTAESGLVVHVPALPEVVTEGDTEEEALAMAKNAIELALESGGNAVNRSRRSRQAESARGDRGDRRVKGHCDALAAYQERLHDCRNGRGGNCYEGRERWIGFVGFGLLNPTCALRSPMYVQLE